MTKTFACCESPIQRCTHGTSLNPTCGRIARLHAWSQPVLAQEPCLLRDRAWIRAHPCPVDKHHVAGVATFMEEAEVPSMPSISEPVSHHGPPASSPASAIGLTVGTLAREPADLNTAASNVVAGTLPVIAGSLCPDGKGEHPTLQTPSPPVIPSADGIDPVEEMEDIVTPVNAERLAHWLDGYEEDAKSFLIKGFHAGFSLQCTHNPSVGSTPSQPLNNHKSAVDQPEIVQQLLGKELEAKRIAGPFNTISWFARFPLIIATKKRIKQVQAHTWSQFPQRLLS